MLTGEEVTVLCGRERGLTSFVFEDMEGLLPGDLYQLGGSARRGLFRGRDLTRLIERDIALLQRRGELPEAGSDLPVATTALALPIEVPVRRASSHASRRFAASAATPYPASFSARA